jgi:peptidoglycan/xylan/chitin deacetylase (PgdA/CDA1 family)
MSTAAVTGFNVNVTPFDPVLARQKAILNLPNLPNYAVIEDWHDASGWSAFTTGAFDVNAPAALGEAWGGVASFIPSISYPTKTYGTNFSLGNLLLCRIRTDVPANVARIDMRFSYNNSQSNYFNLQISPYFPSTAIANQTYYSVTGIDAATVVGSPSWANVNTVTFYVDISGPCTLKIGKIETYTMPARLTIWFDDGLEGQYTKAYPYMKSKGIVGTCAIIGSFVDSTPAGTIGGYMTSPQLSELVANGWELGNHTWSHATAGGSNGLIGMPIAAAITDIEHGKAAVQVFSGGQFSGNYFVPPHHKTNAAVYTEIEKVSVCCEGTPGPTANVQPIAILGDVYNISSIQVDGLLNSPSYMNGLIDTFAAQGKWYCMTFHDIQDGVSGDYIYATADFETIIDHIAALRDAGTIVVSNITDALVNQGCFYPEYKNVVEASNNEPLVYPVAPNMCECIGNDAKVAPYGPYGDLFGSH